MSVSCPLQLIHLPDTYLFLLPFWTPRGYLCTPGGLANAQHILDCLPKGIDLDDIQSLVLGRNGDLKRKGLSFVLEKPTKRRHTKTQMSNLMVDNSYVPSPPLLQALPKNCFGSFSHSLKCGFIYLLPNPQESLSCPGPLSFSSPALGKKKKCARRKSYNYWI